MTFKPITYETYEHTETWGVDYENSLVLTPGGNVLKVPHLIEWVRYLRSEAARLHRSIDRRSADAKTS